MPRALSTSLSLALAALCSAPAVSGQAPDPFHASADDMAWWREARFGMFIHWGPVSIRGTEISWSRGGERPGVGGTGQIPLADYDTLYQRFDPKLFNADEWVALAKSAGMKYLVFTTKHHDGFSMFNSQYTDFKITNSPFGRDVVRELADACHRAGIRLGFYYSPADWHHPDFLTANHSRYVDYFHRQIRELMRNYGRVDILWFDGLSGNAQDYGAEALFPVVRALQPHIIINNRCGLPADFDTPEQTIGTFQTTRPWESCITIGDQWAYRPNDNTKSLKQCIDTLVRCAGGDGNLLLNVGPTPLGQIEPGQADRLREIGAWLRKYGQTIYGTRGGPFRPGQWGAATCKGNTVYLHLLSPSAPRAELPPLAARVVSCRVVTGGAARFRQSDEGLVVQVRKQDMQDLDTIVALRLDRPASDVPVPRVPSRSVAYGKPATASNVFQNMPVYGPPAALDDNPDTRWATDQGVHQAWLEVDLGKECEIGKAFISEAFDRVQSWELQFGEGDAWRTFYKGERIGTDCQVSFQPVKAKVVRLNILQATEGPTIWELQLLPPQK